MTSATDGTLAFATHWQPPLKTGRYTITVQHDETDISGFAPSPKTISFVAHTERFRLQPDDVYSVYPPKNATGIFPLVLPNIVFTRATFPWELAMSFPENKTPCPWVCLLLVNERDEAAPQKKVRSYETSVTKALSRTGSVLTPNITPDQDSGESGESPCRVLELSHKFFRTLIPSVSALSFAAHVRKVNLDYKVTDPTVPRGIFACVMSSRFARSPAPLEKKDPAAPLPSQKYTAHVVSLEKCEQLFTGEPAADQTVRLFSLFHWDFFVQARDFDFKTCMENLDTGVLRPPLPEKAYEPDNDATKQVAELAALGFTPMEHRFRDGSSSLSWYRGPLCPGKPADEEIRDSTFSHCAALADENLMYDPENGMFDVSRAVPWQLGRLKTLEDQGLAGGLIRWRMALKQKAAMRENKAVADANLPDAFRPVDQAAPGSPSSPRAPFAMGRDSAMEGGAASPYGRLFASLLDDDTNLADPTGLRGTDHEKVLQSVATKVVRQEEGDDGLDRGFVGAAASGQAKLLHLWDEALTEQPEEEP